MNQNLVATHRLESLTDIAIRVRENDVSAVAIVDDGRLLGIITERDLARATADGLSPAVTPASSCMTTQPFTMGPEEDAEKAVSQMAARRIRHIPIEDSGQIVGFLSARDLLRTQELTGELTDLAHERW